MKTEKKIFKHVLVDKVPYFMAVVFMLFGLFLPHFFDNKFEIPNNEIATFLIKTVIAIAISLCLLLLFTRWFYPEYDGFFTTKGLVEGLKLSAPFYIFWIVWFLIETLLGYTTPTGDIIRSIVSGINAGIEEEVAFRGLAVTLLLRNTKKESRILSSPIFVGVFFGAVHFLNLTSGEGLVEVVANAIFAAAVGLIFGAVYTLSGNLWCVAFAHFIYDTFTFLFDHAEVEGFAWTNAVDIGAMIVMAVVYVVYLCKNKEKAHSVWKEKWKIEA